MILNETEFQRLADDTLSSLFDTMENAGLDADYDNGALTVTLPSGKQWLLNKHAPSRQLWLASPISGGLHFSYDDGWKLPDGRTLREVLAAELPLPDLRIN